MKKREEKFQDRCDDLAEHLVTPERYAKATAHHVGEISMVHTVVDPDTNVILPEKTIGLWPESGAQA